MLRRLLRPVFRRLPKATRRSIRALRLEYLVRRGIFQSDEPEFVRVKDWLKPGDVALDVGANFGAYTLEMSRRVGDTGRVFAFEPVPQTFIRRPSAGPGQMKSSHAGPGSTRCRCRRTGFASSRSMPRATTVK